MQINLAGNQLCGLDQFGFGTYTAEGIKTIADAIRVSRSLNTIILHSNKLGVEGAKALAPAIRDSRSLSKVFPPSF